MPTPPRIAVRYLNQAGALVTIAEHDSSTAAGFKAECTGCLDTEPGPLAVRLTTLRETRAWASAHAAACRALPQPEPQV